MAIMIQIFCRTWLDAENALKMPGRLNNTNYLVGTVAFGFVHIS